MLRSRSWFGGVLGRPKNVHSLEHLKYLYNVLSKNQTVSARNRSLLVETLRSIAEILIWGDQNDSTVFDFFLEKNMLSFFLKIMKQKCGSYVCVQLLQTLNILFENIRNETSLYYLLSNNHVNSIIFHKFDFSDEEVMAYYISFLKTLSLKLNTHTIHFFFNEHTNDFPLYTEAIKFFNHSETMVRIAVRTLTLNVYRVHNTSMLDFIRNKTAAPYFSNLVWFIGKHVAELDACLRSDTDHQSSGKLADLVAEHLDHLHYLNDILQLDIEDLNEVLTDHLLNKLFIPLYIGSLSCQRSQDKVSYVSKVVALFLLSQVFLIISHAPLVQVLAEFLLDSQSEPSDHLECSTPGDVQGCDNLNESASSQISNPAASVVPSADDSPNTNVSLNEDPAGTLNASISDEEKSKIIGLNSDGEIGIEIGCTARSPRHRRMSMRPCLHAILHSLDITGDDYTALFAMCLLYAIEHNKGVGKERLRGILSPADSENDYNLAFIEKLVKIACHACALDPYIRLVALELSLKVLRVMALVEEPGCVLTDASLAALAGGLEKITSVLRSYYKTEEMFLDLFEDEYNQLMKKPLNVEFLMMDAAVLLPPTATPMTGIEFSKRLPCGEVERVRRSIRVFFLLRQICIDLDVEKEVISLPLTSPQSWIQVDNVLNLNNSDLIACTVVSKDGTKIRRFMVIFDLQFILVDPDTRRLGWGVAKLVGLLQDLEVNSDKDSSRVLHITLHRPLSSSVPSQEPLFSAMFHFDDHIRCRAAEQRLTKGRIKARQKKMQQIAKLLDIPAQHCPSPSQILRHRLGGRSRDIQSATTRYAFTPDHGRDPSRTRSRDSSGSSSREGSISKSRESSAVRAKRRTEGSPLRMPRPRSEEIPLEDIRSRQRRDNILLAGVSQNRFVAPQLTGLHSGLSSSSFSSPLTISLDSHGETSFTKEASTFDQATASPSASVQKDEPTLRNKGQVETV